eukprot:TRINITY_DN1323_c0_g1_i1.p1 TRINITY_DN1323_c0_g1~~TRINITY_DN1323_c0_g1_i1.p1  ORF type:complete len:614 (-),score=134.56 TRINITY_DN1323_c0_g1_i1:87-1928(-)
MIAELLNLSPAFAAIPDPKDKVEPIKVSCRVSDDCKKLLVHATNKANAAFQNEFEEADLLKMKEGSAPWPVFFKDLDKAFLNKEIKASYDGVNVTLQIKSGSVSGTFPLVKSERNGGFPLLEQLWRFYDLRTCKVPEAELNDMKKKDDELKKKAINLDQEKRDVTATISQCETEEKTLMEKYTVLTAELNELVEAHKAAGVDPEALAEEGPIEPDMSSSLCRVPLGERNSRQYDKELFRLIKSRYTPMESEGEVEGDDGEVSSNEDSDPRHMKVIRPYTKSEYEERMRNISDETRAIILKLLEKIDQWDYNVWAVQDFTDKGALFHTAYTLFVRYDFLRKFNIDEEVAINFFSQIEAGYHPNPYHNSMHGADVLHVMHYIISPGGLRETSKLSDQDVLAAIIAGMIHDYDHPGLNNNFHVKVQSYLATLYNDRSILENHHCAEVFELIKLPRFNILASLPDDQRRDIRETVIDMVLSTDMGMHAKIFATWKRRIGQDHDLHKRKDDQRLALALAIKMSDISNCGRPEDLYLRWASKLSEEFFLQGDNERNRGDPVSPFMDRFAPSMAKSQIAFMNYIVIPMFESISEYLPELHFAVDHCESNKNYWASNDDSI